MSICEISKRIQKLILKNQYQKFFSLYIQHNLLVFSSGKFEKKFEENSDLKEEIIEELKKLENYIEEIVNKNFFLDFGNNLKFLPIINSIQNNFKNIEKILLSKLIITDFSYVTEENLSFIDNECLKIKEKN